MKHSALVVWSLDDEAAPRVRAARASLSAIVSAENLHKAASYMGGKGSDTQQAAKARMKRLKLDVQAEFGFLQLNPLELEGESVATPAATLRHFGGRCGDPREWEGIYDYLCSTGTHPSLSGFEYFGPTGIEIKPDTLNRLLRSAIVPYVKALEYFCSYMGWSDEPIDAYVDRANAVLGPTMRTPESGGTAGVELLCAASAVGIQSPANCGSTAPPLAAVTDATRAEWPYRETDATPASSKTS